MCRSRILAGVSGHEQKERLDDQFGKILEMELRRFGRAKLWGEYLKVFEDVTSATSTEEAPWYAVPGESKWYRSLIVAERVVIIERHEA